MCSIYFYHLLILSSWQFDMGDVLIDGETTGNPIEPVFEICIATLRN